ncbi:Sodium transport ATPase 5 like protein [Verticillium longisporum]|uniref:P-type Na(+) transporter n=1 Tax=Verticillium longisporum TaxID=100787 RepID=A0A8I2ZXX3_VERLO|nr:Sodium transport ATPase 5 like protein [Verticillium longisporum]
MSEKQAHQATEGHVSGQANEPMTAPAHALSAAQVVEELQTDPAAGLTIEEASLRLSKYGVNDFEKEKGVRPLQIFIAQIVNSMVMVLLLALAASFAIQAWIEGGVLAALILINVVIGFFQDLQAARTIASLQSLNSPTASVIRGGASTTVEKATLVPGDIIELKTGDMVPADVRLIDTVNLEADEALLTGESVPARKDPKATFDGEDTGPGDRLNVAFSSTTITKGRGRAVVFATGMSTEIGAIAAALHDQGGDKRKPKKDADGNVSLAAHFMYALGCLWDWCGAFLGLTVGTPLQRKLSRLFLYIFMFAIVCALIVLGANGMEGRRDVIIYAVATAIGTLPVTLVLVLTITMAAGTKVMVERNVLVRNMRSLEALGGVTNICSDKTGTLTQGKMVVRMAWLPSLGTYSVGMSNEPYNPEVGGVSFTVAEPKDIPAEDTESAKVMPADEAAAHSPLRHYLDVASLANLATVQKVDSEDAPGTQVWKASGDPTEIAIQVLATRFGRTSPLLASSSEWKQLAEFPFDSAIKKMSVLLQNEVTGVVHAFTKGAVERVIDSCTSLSATSDGTTPMTDAIKADILANMEALARRGLRVLALASKSPVRAVTEKEASSGNLKRDEFEDDLIFRGLVGIYDPPRPESRPSVFKCHQAGIGVHMLTGDHPETARAIAGEVGILPSRMDLLRRDIAEGMVMTAHDFDQLTDEQVDQLPELPLVVARCAPSTKVRMIDALHRRGRYVAMTGDGVNDSPSLHRADVGIAMGEGGSDVAKSFMLHVLAANVGFVTTLLIGLAYKDQDGVSIFQLTPVEILFMLLVAGAFTETGLGFESASPDILNRPPQSLKYGVFTPEFLADIAAYGVLMAICILSSFVVVIFGFYGGNLGRDCNLEWSEQCNDVFRARSTCYTAMMWIFLFFAWELRLWRNKFLFWSVILGTISVFPTLYIPVIDHVVFLHDGIDKEWGIAIAMTALFFAGAEGWKWAKRVYLRRHNLMVRKDAGATEEDLEARVFERFYQGQSDGSLSEK